MPRVMVAVSMIRPMAMTMDPREMGMDTLRIVRQRERREGMGSMGFPTPVGRWRV